MLRDTIQNPFRQNSVGIMEFYDSTRNTFVSLARETVSFGIGHRGIVTSRYLYAAGKVQTKTTGYRLQRNAIITSLAVQTSNDASGTFTIRRNDSNTSLYDLTLFNEKGKSIDGLNILIDKDDWLQIYLNNVTIGIDFPVINLELAWR
jgi:hypothetical protein